MFRFYYSFDILLKMLLFNLFKIPQQLNLFIFGERANAVPRTQKFSCRYIPIRDRRTDQPVAEVQCSSLPMEAQPS